MIQVLWKKTPLKILFFLAIMLSALFIFEQKAHEIRSKDIVVEIPSSIENYESHEEENTFLPVATNSQIELWYQDHKYLGQEELLNQWNKQNFPNTQIDYYITEAKILINSQQYHEALKTLENMSNAGYESSDYWILNAVCYSKLNDTDNAINSYQQAIAENQNSFVAHYNYGIIQFNLNRYSMAEQLFTKAIELSGGLKKSKSLRLLAKTKIQQGNSDAAFDLLEESILLDPRTLESRLLLAKLYHHEPDQAQKYYDTIEKLDPSYLKLWLGRSELALETGKPEDALAVLAKAQPFVKESWQLTIARSKIYLGTNQISKAKSILQEELLQNEDNVELIFHLARVFYAASEFPKAEEQLLALVNTKHPLQLESMNNLGLVYLSTEDYDKAEVQFKNALMIRPEYASALYNLGIVYLEQQQYYKALEYFNSTVTTDSHMQKAWYNLGYCHGQLDNNEAAISSYEKALLLKPEDQRSRLNLAVQYRKVGNNIASENQYTILLQQNPNYPQAWFNYGILKKEHNEITEAERAYRKALELSPENASYALNLSALLASMNKIEEAINVLTEAIEVNNQTTSLRYNLALQYKKLGLTSNVIKELTIATNLDPENPKLWRLLAGSYQDNGDFSLAVHAYTKAIDFKTENLAFVHYLRAKNLFELDRFNEAKADFDFALTELPQNAFIWYNAGKNYQALEDIEKAQNYYHKAVSLNPDLANQITNRLEMIESSETMYTALISKEPNNLQWRLELAFLLNSKDKTQDAFAILEEAKTKFPDNLEISMSIAQIYRDNENFTMAMNTYDQICSMQDAPVESFEQAASLAVHTKNWTDSLAIIEKGLIIFPKNIKLLTLKAETLYNLERYRAVLDLEPAHSSTAITIFIAKAYYKLKNYNQAETIFKAILNSTEEKDIWTYIWLARCQRKQHKYELAESNFKLALQIDPDHRIALTSFGDLYREIEDFEAARLLYKRALEQDPTNSGLRNRLESL